MLASKPMSASVEPLLSRIRSTTRTALLRGLLAGAAAGFCSILLFSASAVALGLSDAGVAILQAILLAGLVTGLVMIWLQGRRRFGDDAVQTAARLDEVLGSALQDAVELERDRHRFGASEGLTEAALKRQLALAEQEGLDGRWEAHRLGLEKRAWLGFGVSALALLGAAVLAPRAVGQGASAWASVQSFEDPFETVPPEPRLGDYRITYRFPDYAGRPPQTLRSTDGSLQALPGTEVEIETEASKDLRQAALALSLEGEEGEIEQQVAAEVDGPRLRATFVLRRPGRYRIKTVDANGRVEEERRGHLIRLDLDEPPRVRLLRPSESPMEVDASDQLELEYTAEDDYGLAEAVLRWRVLGSERAGSIPLASFTDRKRARSTSRIPLSDMALQPGDRVAYSVDVSDGDRINGPKFGGSRTLELRVYSQRDHHKKVLSEQMKALDELVHLLGDHLERPFSVERFENSLQSAEKRLERAGTARELLVAAEAASREDPLGRPQVAAAFARTRVGLGERSRKSARALRLARRSPKPSIGKRIQRVDDDTTGFLEQNAVYLADLLDDQRMIDAEKLAEALREEQQALKALLEEYKTAPSEEAKAAIRASIQSMQNRIREMMQELAGLQSTIPQDYMNREALNQDWQAMDGLSQMLEEGNIDDALSQVDRMLQQSERMLAQLQEGRETLGAREYSEIGQRAEEIWQDLEDLTMRQEELSRRTEEVARAARARLDAKVDATDGFIDRQMARLDRATEALQGGRNAAPLPDAEGFEAGLQRLEDARTALEAKDFGAAQDVLKQGVAELDRLEREARRRLEQVRRFGELFQGFEDLESVEDSLQQARRPTERVLEDLEALTPSPESVLSSEERRRLERMEQEQAELGQRANQLEQQLSELGEQLPIVGEEVGETMQEVQQAMGEAQARLGQSDAPGGLSQERRALEGLRGLRGQLEQMGQGGGSGGGGGVPLPFGTGQASGGEGGSGKEMQSRERVEIPKPEAFEAPTEFREELLEAAKKGTVEAYKDAVRRYYEELVQ
ncbi:MAG: DUF4175 family protein [Myxococcota bacterium]